jgi:hypothetical protein
MKQIMIDLETLGTTADAVILSIGAVKFDLATGKLDDDGFYRSVSVESNLALKRRISEDTLIWWLKQEPAAQKVFREAKETLGTALEELQDWIDRDDYEMWSNGADFDLPMLSHAFTQLEMQIPWKFWNQKCFRTFKGLPGAKAVMPPMSGTAHNALADAVYQAEAAIVIQQALFGKKVKA